MITITRRQARSLRGILRRSVLGISHRGIIPPLVLRAEGMQLRAQYRYPKALAVEHIEPGVCQGNETIALPLDALGDFEGSADSQVMLVAVAPDRTVIRWDDRGIPQSREYTIPPLTTPEELPGLPDTWVDMPAELLDVLVEAGKTGIDDSPRYALNCMQLRGNRHDVVATDGHQLMVFGGIPFPWTDDVLIRSSPVFASRELPRNQPVATGKTDDHVVFRAGPWTLFSMIQKDLRFPKTDDAIPSTQGTTTRLRLDAGDAAFLAPALERLPAADVQYSPVTLECNGRIALRARGADQTQSTELVLSRSRYTGTPVRLNTDRTFLARALALGFSEIEIVDAKSPVVCRDHDRIFCWQPLSHESALEPTDDVIRIESAPETTSAAIPADEPPRARTTVNNRTTAANESVPNNGTANGHVSPETTEPTSLGALIQEAETLHETLSDVKTRAGRLIVALRRYRKRERLVASTLASLRELKLSEVTE